jgi:hypothetical protein
MAITPLSARQAKYPKPRPLASRQPFADYATGFFPSALRPVRGALTTSWLNYSRPSFGTEQLRRFAAWGIPGICTSTVLHQVEGLEFEIVNKDGKADDVSEYYMDLITYANDGIGGASEFMMRYVSDILSCKEGAYIEIVRNFDGVPTALYNIDGVTMRQTHDPDFPYAQHYSGRDYVYFALDQILQLKWRAFSDWNLVDLNLTPIQVAYNGIFMLAAGDDYNKRLLGDEVPSGILNLGENFDRKTALEWKSVWDAEMSASQQIGKFGILWGTPKIDFHPFAIPPKDMAFSETAYWYAVLVASAFELSPLDIGIALSKVTTGAAADQQAGLAKRQGLTALVRKLAGGFGRHILPRGYRFKFADIDKDDKRTGAAIAQMETQAIGTLVESLGPEAGLQEALAKGILSSPDIVQKAVAWTQQKMQQEVTLKQTAPPNRAGNDQTSQDTNPNRADGSNQP